MSKPRAAPQQNLTRFPAKLFQEKKTSNSWSEVSPAAPPAALLGVEKEEVLPRVDPVVVLRLRRAADGVAAVGAAHLAEDLHLLDRLLNLELKQNRL